MFIIDSAAWVLFAVAVYQDFVVVVALVLRFVSFLALMVVSVMLSMLVFDNYCL